MLEGGPSTGEVDRAIEIVQASRKTHVEWLDWREKGNDDEPGCGDAGFHAGCIEDYDHVLDVLRNRARRSTGTEAARPDYPHTDSLAERVREIMPIVGHGPAFMWTDSRAEAVDQLRPGEPGCHRAERAEALSAEAVKQRDEARDDAGWRRNVLAERDELRELLRQADECMTGHLVGINCHGPSVPKGWRARVDAVMPSAENQEQGEEPDACAADVPGDPGRPAPSTPAAEGD